LVKQLASLRSLARVLLAVPVDVVEERAGDGAHRGADDDGGGDLRRRASGHGEVGDVRLVAGRINVAAGENDRAVGLERELAGGLRVVAPIDGGDVIARGGAGDRQLELRDDAGEVLVGGDLDRVALAGGGAVLGHGDDDGLGAGGGPRVGASHLELAGGVRLERAGGAGAVAPVDLHVEVAGVVAGGEVGQRGDL